ncbi:MAG: hypothetical protein ACLU2U_08110, partial [Bifidobacterium angulatum]
MDALQYNYVFRQRHRSRRRKTTFTHSVRAAAGAQRKGKTMASAHKSAWKNPSYLQSSFGIFMFFCSWGIWW